MATRNPNIQTRTQYGHYWGVYATPVVLPNTAGLVAPINLLTPLEQGDIAYVSGGATPGFYQCDNAGTPGVGNAVWSAIGSAFSALDRFGPTHLVGNTVAGDSAVAYSSGGFNYYPDTGNGAGIATALAACGANPGRVYIRRGTYDFGAGGAPATPLVVPAGTTVQGEGNATILQASLVNQGVFNITGNLSGIEQLRINAAASATSLGSVAVVRVSGSNATLADLRIDVGGDAAGSLRRAIDLIGATNARMENITISVTAQTGSLDPMIGIGADTASATARSIIIAAPDRAISLNDTNLDMHQLQVTDFTTNVLVLTNTGSVSLVGAVVLADGTIKTAEAFILEGNAHTFVDVEVVSPGIQLTGAFRFSSRASSGHVIDNCRVTGNWARAFVLGATGVSVVSNTKITNCVIEASSIAVAAAEDTSGLVVAKNQITVTSGGSIPVVAGILIEAGASRDNTIEGNSIGIAGSQGVWAIDNRGRTSTIRGNMIAADPDAIRTEGERNVVSSNTINCLTQGILVVDNALYNVVTDNVCQTVNAPYANAILIFGGDYGVCSNNVTIVTSGAPASSPGILLTAASSNSNCIGNVCRGSSVAPIIDDLGTANNVAQNVGAV